MSFRRLTCFISIIINYSSNEKAFIDPVLSESLKFAQDIVVSYGSHLLDGTPEDKLHLNNLKSVYPTVTFVEYEVEFSLNLSQQAGIESRPTAYWPNVARWTAVKNLRCKQWVFVIDTDEIPDGKLVRKWSRAAVPHLIDTDCYKISNFWYFKKPTYQATTYEDSPVLIHYKHLTEANVFGDWERQSIVDSSGCTLHGHTRDNDGSVLWHHFSWVRSKAGLRHKVTHWSHADEFEKVDVTALLETIFQDDNVNDVIHGYEYTIVNNTFGIQL